MKKRYIVRYNVEFSKEVWAETEAEAIASVNPDADDWDQTSTSCLEAEEVPA